jgi:hypothetical protein
MKNIIFITALFWGIAHAETIATAPNNANGKIVLTNEVCKFGEKVYEKLYRAYNYSSNGSNLEGCFYLEDETVVVVWADNTTYRYPATGFQIKKQNSSGYKY